MDNPGIFGNVVAPVICMVVVLLLSTSCFLFARAIVAYTERLTTWRALPRALVFV